MRKHRRLAGWTWKPHITKTDALGQSFDRWLFAGQKVPARLRVHAAIALHVERFLGRGDRRRLRRINTYDDDLKILARGQVHHLERAYQSIQIFHAQDLALVVNQRKDDGNFAEVISQPDRLTRFVAKLSVQGKLLA